MDSSTLQGTGKWLPGASVQSESRPEWVEELKASARSTRWQTSAVRWQVAREVAAINYLTATLGSERFLPPIGGWSVDYTVVAAVLDAVRQVGVPVNMVELGSGAGTPWFATIAKHSGGHLISVEHDPEFAAGTTALLDHYGLGAHCTVVTAELTEMGESSLWYDVPAVLAAVGSLHVDVLVIDGPPNDSGQQPRRPALFVMEPHLTDNALVVLDDVVRAEEQQTLAGWREAFGNRIRTVPLLDSAAMFRFSAAAPRDDSSQDPASGRLDLTPIAHDEE